MWVVRLRGRRIRKGELTGGRRLGVALSNGSISRGEAFYKVGDKAADFSNFIYCRLIAFAHVFFQFRK